MWHLEKIIALNREAAEQASKGSKRPESFDRRKVNVPWPEDSNAALNQAIEALERIGDLPAPDFQAIEDWQTVESFLNSLK